MNESPQIRWVVESFDSSNIPNYGYVFFSCCKSYICYPGEPIGFTPERMAAAITALRHFLKQEPPKEILISDIKIDRVSPSGMRREPIRA
ncbi:hypothetical protein [Burkholderia sp. Bp8992]|uniref:hypothetical protein n=1 Tax=Burkholderia sp. Bp8992 TaxID=2184554 RepID=UPI000F57B8F2|nr:hypothetical protein [Burkholderia sp. Bp8992]